MSNSKESVSRSDSLGLMRRFEGIYGDNTANYYKACLNALYNNQITPASVVGGGLRDGRGAAEKWLKKKIEEAERAGNIGQGNVTVSKPAKPTYSETDGYYYYVKDDSTNTLLWFGWTPSHKGANRAYERARQLVSSLISYGDHYTDDLQEKLNSNRKLSKLPAEKKSIATKGYDSYKVGAGWASAASVHNSYDTRGLVNYNTEHLTRKELKLFAKFVKLIKTAKQGNEVGLRNKVIRLAHSKPELRKHLLPILKEAKADTLSRSIEDEGSKWGVKLFSSYNNGEYVEYQFRGEFQKKSGIMISETFQINAWYTEDEFEVFKGGRKITSFRSERQLYRNIYDVLSKIFSI